MLPALKQKSGAELMEEGRKNIACTVSIFTFLNWIVISAIPNKTARYMINDGSIHQIGNARVWQIDSTKVTTSWMSKEWLGDFC
jgi:hypothetical protein